MAESTGKAGTGVVPLAAEPAGVPFGGDRVAVAIVLGDEGPGADRLDRARRAGLPMATLHVPEVAALGAEFLRWEVATATAGLLLGINPFDEPNVQEAKEFKVTLELRDLPEQIEEIRRQIGCEQTDFDVLRFADLDLGL